MGPLRMSFGITIVERAATTINPLLATGPAVPNHQTLRQGLQYRRIVLGNLVTILIEEMNISFHIFAVKILDRMDHSKEATTIPDRVVLEVVEGLQLPGPNQINKIS